MTRAQTPPTPVEDPPDADSPQTDSPGTESPDMDTGVAGESADRVTEAASAAVEIAETLSPEAWVGVALGVLVLAAAVFLAVHFSIGYRKRTAVRAGMKRARTPVLIAGLAFAGALALPVVALPEEVVSLAAMAIRMLGIIALGWALATAGDGVFKRWSANLDLSPVDNMRARSRATQLNIFRRIWVFGVGFVVLSMVLLSIPALRNIGVSLFASAGVAGIVIGVAAQPVLSNLVAGLQIAISQPIRIEDAVIVEDEWGWIEEIGLFHVVIRLWDWRRLVVPLTYFSSTPFENWTKTQASMLGSIFWRVDYRAPIHEMRSKLEEILEETDLWDRQAKGLQVTDSDETTLTVRALASASTSIRAWDLRCHVREQMIVWLQQEHPYALPRQREQSDETQREDAAPDWAEPPSRRPTDEASNQPVRDEGLQRGPEAKHEPRDEPRDEPR